MDSQLEVGSSRSILKHNDMKVQNKKLIGGAVGLAAVCGTLLVAVNGKAAKRDPAITKIVNAANAFVATLDDSQRKREMFAYGDTVQQKRWSNFPTSFVRRAGLNMGELSDTQRAAAMTLLAAALSKKGYTKVQEIMGADENLHQTEGQDIFGKKLYYISILGTPSATQPWMLQFGGHHLALNLVIAGEKGILTPSLTGAQPATYVENGKTIRPLAGESDKGQEMLDCLDAAQKKKAVLSYEMADLALGPGQDGKTLVPEGLKASDMTDKQKAMLLDLISEWAGIVHEDAASARMKEIKAGINDTWFSWSGPTDGKPGKNIYAYYRVQGPKLVIEYSPQGLGGDPANHVHTIYRDPTNEYGSGLTGK